MKPAAAFEPVRFAVVGCGALARGQHIPNIAASDKTVLQVCCDLSDEALAECRDKHGAKRITKDFSDAINDPQVDAICVATTEKLRQPVISAAAKARKPVYCEKPVARTLEEMYEIHTIVKEANLPFCVGHNRRSSPAMIEAHDIFARHMSQPNPCAWRWNREGDNRPKIPDDAIASMSVRINDDWHSWKGWVFDKSQSLHGPMMFEMTHFTDLCNWFMGSQPVEVVALESGMLNHGVVIRYERGEIATIMMGSNGTFGYPKELYEIFGNGGAVVIDHMLEIRTAGVEGAAARTTFPMLNDKHPTVGTEGGLPGWLAKKRAACDQAVAQNNPMLQFTAEPNKGHLHQLERFCAEIRGKGPVVCGIDEAILATRVAHAAVKSAHEKRAVKLAEI
jgi:predicted dehydrogenase